MSFNKKDSVADAVQSILQKEEEDCKVKMATPPKDELNAKLINKVEGTTPTETAARTSVKAHGAAVEQPKVGVSHHKESVTLKGFKTRYEEHSIFEQMVNEVLSKDASAGEWIKDFVNSDNPKFAGKSKAERKKQALAAYYAKQKNEEVEHVEEAMGEKAAGDLDFFSKVKGVAKKVGRVLGGPDDEGHRKDLQRKMGAKPEQQHGKKSMGSYNEEAEQIDELSIDTLKRYHVAAKASAYKAYNSTDAWSPPDEAKAAMAHMTKRMRGQAKAGRMITSKGGTPPGVKEDVEQIDELKKSTVKSYLLKKHDKMYDNPAKDPKTARKDLDKLTGAHQRLVGVKPTSEETIDESLYGTRTTNVLNRSHELYDKSRSETDPAKKTALVNQSTKAHKVFSKLRDREIAKDPEGHARKMQSGATQDFKDQEAKRGVGHVRDHVETESQVMDEGWDDMLADVKKRNAPQPNGGSGKKQGSRYGGSKQKDTPEHDEDKKKVNEGKRPEDDSVPFAPPYSKTPAETTDKSGAKHTPMSRAHHLARLAMKKVKTDLGNKGK